MARAANFGEHSSPRCAQRRGASARTAHALALASDGLVSDFVRRDFLRKARVRTAEPEELYHWYVEYEDDVDAEDTPSRRVMPPNPGPEPAAVLRAAAAEHLVGLLRQEISHFWQGSEQPQKAGSNLSGKLLAKAKEIFQLCMEGRELKRKVDELYDQQKAEQVTPRLLQQEGLDVLSSWRDSFWDQFLTDDRHMPVSAGASKPAPVVEVGRRRSLQSPSGTQRPKLGSSAKGGGGSGGVPPGLRSWPGSPSATAATRRGGRGGGSDLLSSRFGDLPDLARTSEMPALFGRSSTLSAFGAFDPSLGGVGCTQASSLPPSPLAGSSPSSPSSPQSLGASWRHDRHARSARGFEFSRLARSQRAAGATLPKITSAMHAAALAADGDMTVVPVLRASASDPWLVKRGSGDLSGVAHSSSRGQLPPVVGFAKHFEAPGADPEAAAGLAAGPAVLRYIRACRAGVVVPTPLALEMARKGRIVANAGEVVTDGDLCAIADMVPKMERLDIVDLTDSSLCGDEAIDCLLKALFGRVTLNLLRLNGCRGTGRMSIGRIVSLLGDGLPMLKKLDLGGVRIASPLLLSLCEAVEKHLSLRSLNIADCGLGQDPSRASCITILLKAPRLEDLDLSWNCLPKEAFEVLGAAVCDSEVLQTLCISNCTGSRTEDGETPINYFLECLSGDKSLKRLDITSNMVDHLGALVLEDALARHANLEELQISNNPLGTAGMRGFLRLLSSETSGLRRFACEACMGKGTGECGSLDPDIGAGGEGEEENEEENEEEGSRRRKTQPQQRVGGAEMFDATFPAGRYRLNLRRASDRAALRLLYRTCERFGVAPEKAFRELEYSEGNYGHAQKDYLGVFSVPSAGVLNFVFSLDEAMSSARLAPPAAGKAAPRGGQPPPVAADPAAGFLSRYAELARVKPSKRKLMPLLSHWRSLKGKVSEQEFFLDALSHDFLLEYPILFQLCKGYHVVEVLPRLFHCVAGGALPKFLALNLPRRLAECLTVSNFCQKLLHFNAENASGHYELDLSAPIDYAVAESIFLLDRWEAVLAQKDDRDDLSMNGDWSNIRNCVSTDGQIAKVTEWHLQANASVHFDFASWRRPPSPPRTLPDDVWRRLLTTLAETPCSTAEQVNALRRASHTFHPKASQLRELLSCFGERRRRVEIAVAMLLRLADPQNMKVLTARMQERGDWSSVRKRLGYLALLPAFQPEDSSFELDLGIREERMAAALMVRIAMQEKIENMQDYDLVFPDETHFTFEQGIPVQWAQLEDLPEDGKLTFRYICSPEDQAVAFRKDIARRYGGWNTNIEADGIVWWSSLVEVPDCLQDFFYQCMRHFKDLDDFFSMADDKNQGTLSYSDFSSVFAQLEWQNYVEDPELIKEVFRQLDNNNRGEVSRDEWGKLRQMWKELRLSILELFQHIDRTFDGDLDAAWSDIDLAGRGSVDAHAWQTAASQRLGYFGPVASTFRYVEKGGFINSEGWQTLKAFWQDREKLRKQIFEGRVPPKAAAAED